MNLDRLEGNWHQFKGRIIERWGRFTHSQEKIAVGHCEHLAGQIQERYGMASEAAIKKLKSQIVDNRAVESNPLKSDQTSSCHQTDNNQCK